MTSKTSRVTEFINGHPSGVRNVQRDSAGRLTDWVENGFGCQLTRDSNGYPLRLVAKNQRIALTQVFSYSGGTLSGTSGDVIPTTMTSEFCLPGGGVGGLW